MHTKRLAARLSLSSTFSTRSLLLPPAPLLHCYYAQFITCSAASHRQYSSRHNNNNNTTPGPTSSSPSSTAAAAAAAKETTKSKSKPKSKKADEFSLDEFEEDFDFDFDFDNDVEDHDIEDDHDGDEEHAVDDEEDARNEEAYIIQTISKRRVPKDDDLNSRAHALVNSLIEALPPESVRQAERQTKQFVKMQQREIDWNNKEMQRKVNNVRRDLRQTLFRNMYRYKINVLRLRLKRHRLERRLARGQQQQQQQQPDNATAENSTSTSASTSYVSPYLSFDSPSFVRDYLKSQTNRVKPKKMAANIKRATASTDLFTDEEQLELLRQMEYMRVDESVKSVHFSPFMAFMKIQQDDAARLSAKYGMPDPSGQFEPITKRASYLAALWHKLSAEDKEPFVKLCHRMIEDHFVTRRTKLRTKKPLTAYMLFFSEMYPLIKHELQEQGKATRIEIVNEVVRRWKSATVDKRPFQIEALRLKSQRIAQLIEKQKQLLKQETNPTTTPKTGQSTAPLAQFFSSEWAQSDTAFEEEEDEDELDEEDQTDVEDEEDELYLEDEEYDL